MEKRSKKCLTCGGVLTSKSSRKFCGSVCRNRFYALKYADYRAEYQRKKRDNLHTKSNGHDLQCPICGNWYVQLITHVIQIHKIDNLTFREEFNLPLKVGIVPKWYHNLKKDITIANKSYKSIAGKKLGAKEFKKGDIRSKTKRGWKSTGSTDWRNLLK